MPNVRWLLALVTAAHRALYRGSGGWLGHRAFHFHFLLLGCRGRRSGREYVTPLLYLPDGARFVVVGSNAGDARPPAWWLNLRAQPRAWVQVGRERFSVAWRLADPAEAAALWPRFVATYGSFARYRETAGREIPVVVLERAQAAARR